MSGEAASRSSPDLPGRQLELAQAVIGAGKPVAVVRLKGFERLTLRPGERRRLEFQLGPEQLGFYDRDLRWIVEPGEFQVRVSDSSIGGLSGAFVVR